MAIIQAQRAGSCSGSASADYEILIRRWASPRSWVRRWNTETSAHHRAKAYNRRLAPPISRYHRRSRCRSCLLTSMSSMSADQYRRSAATARSGHFACSAGALAHVGPGSRRGQVEIGRDSMVEDWSPGGLRAPAARRDHQDHGSRPRWSWVTAHGSSFPPGLPARAISPSFPGQLGGSSFFVFCEPFLQRLQPLGLIRRIGPISRLPTNEAAASTRRWYVAATSSAYGKPAARI